MTALTYRDALTEALRFLSGMSAVHLKHCERCKDPAQTPCPDGQRIAARVTFETELRRRNALAEAANAGDEIARQILVHLDELKVPAVLAMRAAGADEVRDGGRRT